MTGMLNSAMPILTVVVGLTMFKIPTASKQLLGVATGLGGLVLIGIPEVTTDGTNALGVLLVVLAVLSYAVAVHIAGPLQRSMEPFRLFGGRFYSLLFSPPLMASLELLTAGSGGDQ